MEHNWTNENKINEKKVLNFYEATYNSMSHSPVSTLDQLEVVIGIGKLSESEESEDAAKVV